MTIRKSPLIAGSIALAFLANPATAQIVSGSGGLVGSGQANLPGIGANAQGSLSGSVGVDANELRDRTRSTVRGTIETSKRVANRAKTQVQQATPSVSASAQGSVSASPDEANANASARASVRPD